MIRSLILIALPKGRYFTASAGVARRLCNSDELPSERTDVVAGETVRVILAKPRDIPMLVGDRWVDVGVAPEEWVYEYESRLADKSQGSRLEVTASIEYCGIVSNLVWLAPRRACSCYDLAGRPVVTSFPRIARLDLLRRGVRQLPRIVRASGSVEGLAKVLDASALDCFETGLTARNHGMVPIATVLRGLTSCVIVSPRNAERACREAADEVAATASLEGYSLASL
jgi:ATP phosphoribosyltransferase